VPPAFNQPGNITQLISQLVSGPVSADRIFGLPACSFGDLYALAEGLRAALDTAAAGGKKSHPVCLCTADHTVAAAALLASLAGGTALVMPHAYSGAVLEELHQLTRYEAAIVDKTYPLPHGTRQITVTDLKQKGSDLSSPAPLDPDTPWVHLFTGGSTGTPRLWSKTPRNLLTESFYLIKAFSISADDRILTTSPPYHIYGLLYSVLVPLLASAGMITATPAFPGELAASIKKDGPTILVTVPVHYRALKNHLPVKHRLRMAFSSASPLSVSDAEAFTGATGVPIYDVYGSTETGGIASRCPSAGETGYTPFTCIDMQIKSKRLWVRSSFLSPQLPLNPEGYFEAADRIADCAKGRFTLIGRSDGVIKVGGKRVDMEDIKTKLLELNGVRDALVFARPIETGRENEILALVETEIKSDIISRSLDTTLEPYARPRAIRVIAKIPVTITGKYDRKIIADLF
jgi:acyl-coenzyme A synthetase/AMP-(fatty) acid ligase